mmetsp:Transcript_1690/g.2617  ORF Transcript_1690/g.2617 Transcript_1690/m.2617 type:complete len:278 (-) Transcript_1690:89-922(-)|eukprot:CAMPEP_0119005098 /NCGR_PEP_ID=MMETSP1176-20130426/1525_1 /TAXON_ID=265551 /ORGANISM="Synedropsis recta cf, Strain CCMP1620" /LENGTH=277 /DNA_ID=CAMNT_0006956867 /DNA_START=95 /DNA_END=928 /DNA_ORIENTATION=-
MFDNSLNNSIASSTAGRKEPLQQQGDDVGVAGRRKTKGLNETLNTEYIDIPPEDTSLFANTTRSIAGMVGRCCTPRQILVVLRILKALTFAFLVFTVVADLMFIYFVEIKASEEVNAKVGGTRDTIIRVYGLALTVIALLIELDVTSLSRQFLGLKSFIPRALLLFFIATITGSNPLHEDSYAGMNKGDDDDAYGGDDAYGYSDQQVSAEIPSSTVIFQMVTSMVLTCCAFFYLILGLLCVDRLRAKAFMSSRNPISDTAIPTNVMQQTQTDEETAT